MSDPVHLSDRLLQAPDPAVRRPDGVGETSYPPHETEVVTASGAGSWVHGFVVSGAVRLRVAGEEWECVEGDSIAIDGTAAHSVTGASPEAASVVWFALSPH